MHAAPAAVPAAPQHHTGVVAQALDRAGDLARAGGERRIVRFFRLRLAQHHVLPHADPILVAQIVKRLVLIDAAAPDTQTIHIGNGRSLNKARILHAREARDIEVGRHPARALQEHRLPVD